MELDGILWFVLKSAGPIALLVAIAWAIWRNKRSRIPQSTTEAGTRRLYAEEERRLREGSDGAE